MKKTIVAVMLVVTMLMSSVCFVGAAGAAGLTSLDGLTLFIRESLVVGDIQVATTGEYADSISVSNTTEFKAKATLDMTHVKRDIRRAHEALATDELRAELDAKGVSGEFTITVNLGEGIYVIPESATAGDMTGFNEEAKVLFEEDGARAVTDNTITVKVKLKEGTTVADISESDYFDNVDDSELPDEISFEHTGLKTIATAELGGTITGSITIEDLATVEFKFIDAGDSESAIKPAKVSIKTGGPTVNVGPVGGGTATDDSVQTTVPVSGAGGSVNIGATVKDNTVIIGNITTDTLKPVVDKKVETGVVSVDTSAVEGDINKVSIPAIAVDTVADAAKEVGNDVTGLEVVFDDKTSVEVDADAVAKIAEKVTNKPLVVGVTAPAAADDLTAKQKAEVTKLGDGAAVVAVEISTNGDDITDFGEGTVKVTVPYELKDGDVAENVTVWAMDENGNMTEVAASYDEATGTVTFEMNGTGAYVIAADESDEPIIDKPVVAHPVPEMLNGDDHYAYMSGYEDGTIRPNNNITRAEVATIFFRLLKDEVREQYLSYENNFADVNEGDWFNTAVSTMAKAGIVNGRTEDTFAPNEYITRAEFTAICARFDDTNLTSQNKFTDVSDHWAEDYILESVAYGWIEGYEDYTFRPEKNITRAESATLINRVLNRVPASVDAMLENMVAWADNSNSSAWYYIAIQEATNSHTFERVNEVNENWLELTENRDWTVFEK